MLCARSSKPAYFQLLTALPGQPLLLLALHGPRQLFIETYNRALHSAWPGMRCNSLPEGRTSGIVRDLSKEVNTASL